MDTKNEEVDLGGFQLIPMSILCTNTEVPNVATMSLKAIPRVPAGHAMILFADKLIMELKSQREEMPSEFVKLFQNLAEENIDWSGDLATEYMMGKIRELKLIKAKANAKAKTTIPAKYLPVRAYHSSSIPTSINYDASGYRILKMQEIESIVLSYKPAPSSVLPVIVDDELEQKKLIPILLRYPLWNNRELSGPEFGSLTIVVTDLKFQNPELNNSMNFAVGQIGKTTTIVLRPPCSPTVQDGSILKSNILKLSSNDCVDVAVSVSDPFYCAARPFRRSCADFARLIIDSGQLLYAGKEFTVPSCVIEGRVSHHLQIKFKITKIITSESDRAQSFRAYDPKNGLHHTRITGEPGVRAYDHTKIISLTGNAIWAVTKGKPGTYLESKIWAKLSERLVELKMHEQVMFNGELVSVLIDREDFEFKLTADSIPSSLADSGLHVSSTIAPRQIRSSTDVLIVKNLQTIKISKAVFKVTETRPGLTLFMPFSEDTKVDRGRLKAHLLKQTGFLHAPTTNVPYNGLELKIIKYVTVKETKVDEKKADLKQEADKKDEKTDEKTDLNKAEGSAKSEEEKEILIGIEPYTYQILEYSPKIEFVFEVPPHIILTGVVEQPASDNLATMDFKEIVPKLEALGLGGMEKVVKKIVKHVLRLKTGKLSPELSAICKPPRGVMLHGPPGTGL
jgi:hypothetical protein